MKEVYWLIMVGLAIAMLPYIAGPAVFNIISWDVVVGCKIFGIGIIVGVFLTLWRIAPTSTETRSLE